MTTQTKAPVRENESLLAPAPENPKPGTGLVSGAAENKAVGLLAAFSPKKIAGQYERARDIYASIGVDTEKALETLSRIAISLQCWQGDDVAGLEGATTLTGGIMATGGHPGRARTAEELRADYDEALRLIPGRHRLNLHAMYGEFGGKKVDRDAIEVTHFQNWIDWAKGRGVALDFNATYFSHPKADSGFTLAHRDPAVREFWVEHGKRCRRIGAAMGEALGNPCVHNLWIPDGFKDTPVDRYTPRKLLLESLDAIYAEGHPKAHLRDAVEQKLFGIGSESYTVGSHEFYYGYAIKKGLMACLDMGHFHPTESVADKISSTLLFLDEVLLHVSRGIRWDSDHVVILNDDLQALCAEIIRNGFLNRVNIAMDFFDASINRIAAYVTGTRALQKSLLVGLLQPVEALKEIEAKGDLTGRLVLLEEVKALPWSAVWDRFCEMQDVPVAGAWYHDIRRYEEKILSERR